MKMQRLFVTVGSTSFDDLVEEITKDSILQTLQCKGFKFLTIQIGRGLVVPKQGEFHSLSIEVFRRKETIADELLKADLVISHAGAGSCIETLESNKPLIAVVNTSLMDNHQKELAEALSKEGFCKWCYSSELQTTIEQFDKTSLIEYKPGNPQEIVDYIDSLFEVE